jgi:hypothetical protein
MSRIVEIVVDKVPESVHGLEEQLVDFAGERLSVDPKVFSFDGQIELFVQPTAPHILSRVMEKIGATAESLVLNEMLVNDWAANRLNEQTKAALQRLFVAIPRPSIVAIETGVGLGVEVINCAANRTFEVVDPIVRGETSYDLTIVVLNRESTTNKR